MIEEIKIKRYRKLKNIDFKFERGINIISGTNGTCKSSLLYMISNSFQAVNSTADFLNDKTALEVLKKINKLNNPKIESLTRGDKEYNDPAPKEKGPLFTSIYFNGKELNFRRHNSTKDGVPRFALKPQYTKEKGESLPALPIIYLGLFRLFSFGEFLEDEKLKSIEKKLPEQYCGELEKLYEKFTGTPIKLKKLHDMGGIKYRTEFSTETTGIDSNTISAGEDNLFIILTALISLKYYFDSITSNNDVESILLIDEIDATLHPAFQIKIFDIFKDFSQKYKIQIIFTTHSLNLLEYALKNKSNVIYLVNNLDSVNKMDNINKYTIEMHLKNQLRKDIYSKRFIPVFTEDDEARLFLDCLLEYYSENNDSFKKVEKRFHQVEANLSCEALRSIFSDDKILRSTMGSICILDGDQIEHVERHIIVLPGKKAPEDLFFDYSESLMEEENTFWNDEAIIELGYSKNYYATEIRPEIKEIDSIISANKAAEKSNSGIKREKNKAVFKKNKEFFELVIKHWVNNDANKSEINKFFGRLNVQFQKVAELNNINSKDWICTKLKKYDTL
ncbi:MAG: AAA family ATPase [Cetobacterium sp.]